jgi:hypothetical protein
MGADDRRRATEFRKRLKAEMEGKTSNIRRRTSNFRKESPTFAFLALFAVQSRPALKAKVLILFQRSAFFQGPTQCR